MDKLAVRLSGIYALERIAVDSERDHRIIVEVLSAFVREHDPPTATDPSVTGLRIPSDVQTALTVLGRLPQRRRIPRADLADGPPGEGDPRRSPPGGGGPQRRPFGGGGPPRRPHTGAS